MYELNQQILFYNNVVKINDNEIEKIETETCLLNMILNDISLLPKKMIKKLKKLIKINDKRILEISKIKDYNSIILNDLINKKSKINTIKEIDSNESKRIIEQLYKSNKTKVEDFGLYYVINPDNTFTGIDNCTGDAWTEDFKDLDSCIRWLNGDNLDD